MNAIGDAANPGALHGKLASGGLSEK